MGGFREREVMVGPLCTVLGGKGGWLEICFVSDRPHHTCVWRRPGVRLGSDVSDVTYVRTPGTGWLWWAQDPG